MRRIVLVIAALMMLHTIGLAQKTSLVFDLKKDVEYALLVKSESIIKQDVNGQQINITMLLNGDMSYLVTAVTDDGFVMDVSYRSLSLSMKLPQGEVEFSSEKASEEDVFSLILSEMKDKVFNITMTKYGKITEIKNVDRLFESAFKKFPELPEEQIAQIKAQLARAYGDAAFKGNIEMVTAIYPEKKVRKGEEWVIETKLESGMSANMSTTYVYTGKAKNYYTITGKSVLSTADKDAYIESNGVPMKFDLSGTMSSEIKIDKNTGWILEANISQVMEGDTFIKENPQLPNGLVIPMMIKNKIDYSGTSN